MRPAYLYHLLRKRQTFPNTTFIIFLVLKTAVYILVAQPILKKRLAQHLDNLAIATKNHNPLKLIYYEYFIDKAENLLLVLFSK